MEYWQRLVGEWQNSGLSQAEFCRGRGVKLVTFGWWKRKLTGADKPASSHATRDAQRPATPVGQKRGGKLSRGTGIGAKAGRRSTTRQDAGFVEVALPVGPQRAAEVDSVPSAAAAGGMVGRHSYEIALKNGRVICLPEDFDPAIVSRLIGIVESC